MKKILLILVALSTVGISSCGHLRGLTICVSDPVNGGFQCSKDGAEKVFLPYGASEDYIAMPFDDAEKLFRQCNGRKGD